MTKHLREWVAVVEALPEAEGVQIDVEGCSKHWHLLGRVGDVTRRIAVVTKGRGKIDASPNRLHNYRAGVRRALSELRQMAEAAALS